jgi:UDP-N-acetylmuramate: L-alanyl-gamma-D-glutamyl-meso-diaminopimelate ligase
LNFKEYEGALEYADVAVVLFPDAVKIKQLEEVSYDQIAQAFNRKDLIIYKSKDFKDYLFNLNLIIRHCC